MPATVDEITKRLQELKSIRLAYEPAWKDVTNYIYPRRSFWDIDAVEGAKNMIKRYDSTALTELQTLSDGMVANVASIYLRWIHLLMEDHAQNDEPYVRDWLEEIEDIIYGELERSSFYEALSEFVMDAASIGTAVMMIEDDPVTRRIEFSTRHIKECYIAEGRGQKVDTLFREFKMSNRQMVQRWGLDKLSPARRLAFENQPYAKAKIAHAVYPRSDRDAYRGDRTNMEWASVYVDLEQHDGAVIDEGGYHELPAIVWRWRKNSDEWYGRSPATDSVGEVLRLNQSALLELQVMQLAAKPPLNVPRTMKGNEKIIPDGYNYYDDPTRLIFPIQTGQNYPFSKDGNETLKAEIAKIFRSKIYNLMEQLEGGPFTATEINARQGENATLQTPLIGRFSSEGMIPLISRVYRILERAGRLPPPPAELVGGNIKVEIQGPLAQRTKKYHQAQGVDAGFEFAANMAQVFPESLDNIDSDELSRIGLDSKGLPQKAIREKPQVQEIRKMRQDEAARQEQEAVGLEQQKMLAANANKLNEPVKPNSMLAGLGKMAGQQKR